MALDLASLKLLLEQIDANLREPGVICLIGSGATILLGQAARQTEDLDVWARATRVGMRDLKLAVEAAGLSFDPKDEFPNLPYLQIVHPGIVQVPGWDPSLHEWFGEPEHEIWHGERLTVTVPPPSAIAASKLVRGDDRDLEDCLWLMTSQGMSAEAVAEAIRALPRDHRERAEDNLDILSVMRR